MVELIKIKGKDYQLKLTAKATVMLEKKLGRNPLVVFMQMEKGHLPSLEETLTMLYCSLIKFHGEEFPSEDAVYDLYDDYVDEDGTLFELIDVISDVVLNAGFKPKEQDEEAKN